MVRSLELDLPTLGAAPRSNTTSVNSSLPPSPPILAELPADQGPCVQLAMDAAAGVAVHVAVGSTPATGIPTPAAASVGDPRLADEVVVQPGTGLLIRDQPGPGVTDGARYLLVDTGVLYPLPSDDAVKILGYAAVTPTPVPAALLAQIPRGPPLDPAAALTTAPIQAPGRGTARPG